MQQTEKKNTVWLRRELDDTGQHILKPNPLLKKELCIRRHDRVWVNYTLVHAKRPG